MYFFLLKIHGKFGINMVEIVKLFNSALPLIGTSLIAGSAAYIDGFIVKNYYNAETFAIFRYGAKEFPLFLIVASAFSNSMIPEVAKEGNLSNALIQIKESSRKMVIRFFPIAIVLLLTSQYLFPAVFNKDFFESHMVFDIYLLLIISRFIFAQTILIGLKQQKIVFWVSIAELVVNVTNKPCFCAALWLFGGGLWDGGGLFI
jgi:O-antigen/teichoic acid export membrane protein